MYLLYIYIVFLGVVFTATSATGGTTTDRCTLPASGTGLVQTLPATATIQTTPRGTRAAATTPSHATLWPSPWVWGRGNAGHTRRPTGR